MTMTMTTTMMMMGDWTGHCYFRGDGEGMVRRLGLGRSFSFAQVISLPCRLVCFRR